MTRFLPGVMAAALSAAAVCAADPPPTKARRADEQVRIRIVERKLEDWKITKVAFIEATLDEALTFFKAEAKKLDPEAKGVNFVVKPAAAAGAGKVTLSLDEVPFGIALRYAVEALGLEFRVEPFVIVIDKPAAKPSP